MKAPSKDSIYPVITKGAYDQDIIEYGMNIRLYIAVEAMKEFLSSALKKDESPVSEEIASLSFIIADSMIEEANK